MFKELDILPLREYLLEILILLFLAEDIGELILDLWGSLHEELLLHWSQLAAGVLGFQ